MKDKWLKVAAIAMAVALVFTIVASNIVSLTAISAIRAAQNGGTKSVVTDTTAPATNADVTNAETQAVDTSSDTAAVSDTQGNNANTTSSGTNTGTTKASGNTGTTAKQSSGGALSSSSTKAEVFEYYRKAINKIKQNGAAGYTKKEWQELPKLAIGDNATINNFVQEKAAGYMTTSDEVQPEISAKGSKEAKDRFPPCTLTDMSKVQSAVCTDMGTYYKVKIVMADDNTPKKTSNFLGQVTNSILYEEDIMTEVDGLGVVKVKSLEVLYNDFTITCEITKDGNFKWLTHFATVDIATSATILFIPMSGTGQLLNHCEYTAFKY